MMKRRFAVAIAMLAAVALAACQPAINIDPKDPWAKLRPWDAKASWVKKSPKGVQYVVITHGTSKEKPKATDRVEVAYDGRLAADGKKFDATGENETVAFRLDQVIPGWSDGVQQLNVGDRAMLYIPAALGYGAQGAGGVIPPNADLMFDVTLKRIVPTASSDAAAWKKAMPWPTDGKDVKKTAKGLEYFVISSGDPKGEPPTLEDVATVNYEGRLDDGSTFDSSYADGEPKNFPVGLLIPGWVEALQQMRPGDHWMIRMPPQLAYGSESNGRIPPNSALTFEVELTKVIRLKDMQGAKPAAGDQPADAAKDGSKDAKKPKGK